MLGLPRGNLMFNVVRKKCDKSKLKKNLIPITLWTKTPLHISFLASIENEYSIINISKLRVNRIRDSFFSKQVNETLLIL